MKLNWSIRKEIKIGAALTALVLLIAFSERQQGAIVCNAIVVELDNIHENYYLDEKDVMRLVESGGTSLKGTAIGRLSLREIEARIRSDKHVREAELYGDLKGNLMVHVELRRPIARLIDDNGPDGYISEEGIIMGVSEKFNSRVPLVSGPYVSRLMETGDLNATEEGVTLLAMIRSINEDPFWRAQIAQMDMNSKGEIKIYPQITGQIVEFGTAEGYEDKLHKLMVFYKEILPQKGWTKYERVNLKYNGQIIAE